MKMFWFKYMNHAFSISFWLGYGLGLMGRGIPAGRWLGDFLFEYIMEAYPEVVEDESFKGVKEK